ncbi:alpha/beta fold hydrolase [Isobaculum melis]|uniref:alpha/beta fold hydrolase n=1 Tax=Isobaculum melis TaxID=142588 RepID=UPI0015A62B22|nr:alpha/beta hydrolase [Isobaculum melis]
MEPNQIGSVQVDGADLYYETYGTGPAILCLHGNGGSHKSFMAQVDYFSAQYELILMDSRAHGRSTRGNGKLTFEQMAKDIEALLTQLSIKEVIIFGYSDGGNLALQYALMYPSRVKLIVASGINLTPQDLKRSMRVSTFISYYLLTFGALFNRKIRTRRELLGLIVKQPQLKLSEMQHINCPTLLLVAESDISQVGHTQKVAAQLPNGTAIEVPKVGHNFMRKHPQRFNQIVSDYLGCV